jgi:hypothetical protein
LSDRDLALAADGELSPDRAAAVNEHLASCPDCRGRMNAMEAVMADFEGLYRRDRGASLPPPDESRARLRAGLAAAAPQSQPRPEPVRISHRYAYAAALAGILLVGLAIGMRVFRTAEWGSARIEAAAAPEPHLTPGATVPLTKDQLCRSGSLAAEPAVPASLQQEVFAEYGIANPQPDAYEVDYLITPELGGATSIRNLWPQPYHTTWHARIKDQLEERLHTMVCNGELDLGTAQREIATNWIAAYKKYFHTQKPLPSRALVPRPEEFLAFVLRPDVNSR